MVWPLHSDILTSSSLHFKISRRIRASREFTPSKMIEYQQLNIFDV